MFVAMNEELALADPFAASGHNELLPSALLLFSTLLTLPTLPLLLSRWQLLTTLLLRLSSSSDSESNARVVLMTSSMAASEDSVVAILVLLPITFKSVMSSSQSILPSSPELLTVVTADATAAGTCFLSAAPPPLLLLTPQSIIMNEEELEDDGGDSVTIAPEPTLVTCVPSWGFWVEAGGGPLPTPPLPANSWPDADSRVTKNLGVIRPLPVEALLLPFSNEAVDESGLGQIGEGEGVWHTGDVPLSAPVKIFFSGGGE